MKTWWQMRALPWLKKNWQWVLLPVGLVMALVRLMATRGTTVVAPELLEADVAEKKASDQATRRVEVAEVKKEVAIAKIAKEHREVLMNLTAEQMATASKLGEDPVALHNYLLDVGKKMRK